MSNNISLSLIIPAYNRADLIGETIEAALAQSIKFNEIIVVNDGSTDNTLEILAKFNRYIKIIDTPNQGVQVARNIGVVAAQSTYITLCDSDDLLDANYVITIKKWLDEHNNNKIIYSNFFTFDTHSIYPDKFSLAPADYFSGATQIGYFLTDVPELYVKTLKFQPLFCSGVTIEREFYNSIGGFDTKLKGIGAEDWEFTLRAVANTTTALCMLPIVKVRKHTSNDSANSTRQAYGEALVLEYALAHHEEAKKYKDIFLAEIEHIRFVAFERAFARADFDLACKVARLMRHKPLSVRFWIKRIITLLPPEPRIKLWNATKK